MAVIIKTSNPSGLLQAIYKAIDNKKIETWAYDKDKDLTHEPNQWKNEAWFQPTIYNGELRFSMLKQKEKTMSKIIYGLYHRRFIEMLLTHFDAQFFSAVASAQLMEPDVLC
ncbi:MAG TPA: hypothetical protein VMU29_07265 [Smithella sp.]|nr:hypothetical protein [Smithella sp.]